MFWFAMKKFVVSPITNIPRCYTNYKQLDLQDNYMQSYYASNSDKLIRIKRKYYPNNIFKFQQSIPIR